MRERYLDIQGELFTGPLVCVWCESSSSRDCHLDDWLGTRAGNEGSWSFEGSQGLLMVERPLLDTIKENKGKEEMAMEDYLYVYIILLLLEIDNRFSQEPLSTLANPSHKPKD